MQRVLGPRKGRRFQDRPRLHAEGRRRDQLGGQTKKDFAIAVEQGFVGSKKNAKTKYLSGAEDKFKGPGKAKIKLYADQLINTYYKVEDIAKKTTSAKIDLPKYKIAYSPLPNKDHAFPTPHREATGYPLYVITHKRMSRNQSGFTVNNAILNQALGPTQRPTTCRSTSRQPGSSASRPVTRSTIETRVGKINGTAQVVQGIRPDTIAVSYHYGNGVRATLPRDERARRSTRCWNTTPT